MMHTITPILANIAGPTSSDQMNWNVWGWIVLFIAFGLNIAVQVKALRRSPPLEIDHIKLAATVAELDAAAEEAKRKLEAIPNLQGDIKAIQESIGGVRLSVSGIHLRLGEGDKLMAKLATKQAVNAESINTIKLQVGEAASAGARTREEMAKVSATVKITSDTVLQLAENMLSKQEKRRRDQDS